MTTAAMTAPRFEMGRVVNLTFGAIGRNWLVFGLLALLLSAIPQGLVAWFRTELIASRAPGTITTTTSLFVGGVTSLVAMAGMVIMQAAMAHGVISDLNGRKASFAECLQTGLRFALPVLGILALMILGVGLGCILLIVPGVMLFLAWMVAVPAEVVERTGVFGAFSRSAALTRNHRWSLLGLYAIYFILSLILSMAVLALSGGFQAAAQMIAARAPLVLAVTAVIQVVQTVIASAGTAAIYYELRSIKEGIGPEALASVFD